LTTSAEALSLAKQHLNTQADDLITNLKHRRNLTAPIHRLPQEIFRMVLENFAAGLPVDDKDGLLQLLQVGRLWYWAIVNSPRLWTRLDSALPPTIARLVIERSKGLPILSFAWNSLDAFSADAEAPEEILKMAIQNSARFKSMNFQILPYNPFEIRLLLESKTSALEILTVEVGKDCGVAGGGFRKFALSEGAPLKYLDLSDVSLNFDSPRLSGLITLSLCRAAVPTSLATLLQVLSVTQRLEQLAIAEKRRIGEHVNPGRQITLGHLRELKIEDIANDYCAALLSSIFTPICSRVHVSDSPWAIDPLDPLLWHPGSTQTAALLGLNGQSHTQTRRIAITVECQVVRIRVFEHEGGSPRFFSFKRRRPSHLFGLLPHFFGAAPFCPPIDLEIGSAMDPIDAFDLTGWSTTLGSLQLRDENTCLRALQQLAQRTAVSDSTETGASATQVEDWMCPNLRWIMLHIPESDLQRDSHVAALLALVRRRWSGTAGGPAPANQLGEFYIFCTNLSYQKLRDVEVDVQK
ncbi:hypothetical protein FRC01_013902, partial [Tulasnella sp. 417]